MYSNEDFENFYVRYKAEGLPRNMSLQSWCLKNKVSWKLFNRWYCDTRHKVVPVEIEGHPDEEERTARAIREFEEKTPCPHPVRTAWTT